MQLYKNMRMSASLWKLVLLLMVLMAVQRIEAEEWNRKVDRTKWVDHTDMLRYDPGTKTMLPPLLPGRNSHDEVVSRAEKMESQTWGTEHSSNQINGLCPSTKNSSKPEPYFLKRFIRRLLKYFKEACEPDECFDREDLQFEAVVKVTRKQIEALRTYVSSDNKKYDIHEIDHIITGAISEVRIKEEFNKNYDFTTRWTSWVKKNFYYHLTSPIPLMLIVCITMALLLYYLSPVKISILGIMAIICVSVVCEYIHQFQKLEAKKYAERLKVPEVPPECSPNKATSIQRMWWSIKVDVLGFQDPCKKYFEHLLIDSQYEINPLMAVTHTFGRVIEILSSVFGTSIGLFCNNSLEHFSFLGKIGFAIFSLLVIVAFLYFLVPASMSMLIGMRKISSQMPTRQMIENITNEQQNDTKQKLLDHREPPRLLNEPSGPSTFPTIIINTGSCCNAHNTLMNAKCKHQPSATVNPGLAITDEQSQQMCISPESCEKFIVQVPLHRVATDRPSTCEKDVYPSDLVATNTPSTCGKVSCESAAQTEVSEREE